MSNFNGVYLVTDGVVQPNTKPCIDKCGGRLKVSAGIELGDVPLWCAVGDPCMDCWNVAAPCADGTLKPGNYKLDPEWVPPEGATVVIEFIECDQITVDAGCTSLSDGGSGGTGGGDGAVEVTVAPGEKLPVDLCAASLGPIDVNVIGPSPFEITGSVDVNGPLDVTLTGLGPEFPPIPVTITNESVNQPIPVLACAEDDGRPLLIVYVLDDAGVPSATLYEADGTPAPDGTAAGACATTYVPGPVLDKCVMVDGVPTPGYSTVVFVNPADSSDTIDICMDPSGKVIPNDSVEIVPCPDEAKTCPGLKLLPDILVEGVGASGTVEADTYNSVCISVPCKKWVLNDDGVPESVDVPDDTVISLTYPDGQVKYLGWSESKCIEAGPCGCSCDPRLIGESIVVEVIAGSDGACALIEGDI